jgi:hypothetical protein
LQLRWCAGLPDYADLHTIQKLKYFLAGKRLGRQEFRLGSCKLFIGQHARGVQLGEFIELRGQITRGRSLGRRGHVLRGGRSLLLRLRIGSALLVCLILLLLFGSILLGILLVLVVVYRAGCTGDHCRADRHTGNASSYCSSSHHVDLLRVYFKKGFNYAGCSALEIFAIASSTAS